jgi:hypothetical protein
VRLRLLARLARPLLAAAAAIALTACGGADHGANAPQGSRHDLPGMVTAAMREEAQGDPARAADLWLRAVDAAVDSPEDPWQIAALAASTDALVARSIDAFDDASEDTGLVYRTNDGSFAVPPAKGSIAARLEAAAGRAHDPFSAGIVARALHELATHDGDAGEAAKWRAVTGCSGEATLIGPLSWTAVTGVSEADPLAAATAPLAESYVAAGSFARKTTPVVAAGRGCTIDPALVSVEKGVRDLVVDVKVDAPQTIGVAMRTHGAAVLRAGGKVVAERPYALGGDEVARFARVDVPRAGTLRLVARVGMDDDGEAVEIDAWGADGKALAMHAPKVGEAAAIEVTSSREVPWPAARSAEERTTLAVGALALGDRTTAEEITATDAAGENAPPELLLAYARAVEAAGDLDAVHRAERARGAYEKVLEAWPSAWEPIAAHAVLAGVRRGQTERRIWTLRDLEEHRARARAPANAASAPLLDLFEAAVAGHDRLFDRAAAALERGRAGLPKQTPLVRDVERSVVTRTGAARVAFECTPDLDADHSRLACYDALRAAGDRATDAKELDRMRALFSAPQAYLALTMRDAMADGDAVVAARTFEAMLPGERTLAALYAVKPGSEASTGLASLAPVARDAPVALPGLMRASGSDPTAPFAGVAERVAAQDRASRILPSAATAVLSHEERYDVSPLGLVHFVLFDVRRVSGTTDVEENAQADPPEMIGRTTMRILRRRIFKKDGRILDPERTPGGAAQAHADLSQLEEGDIVEAVYEGWTLPGDTGSVTIDTPDLLPDRTAVHQASIEMRLPTALHADVWAHPTLGKGTETAEGDTRVLRWSLADAGVRRVEEGTPKMDQDVAVSLSTATWDDSARALRETLAALDDRDAEVRAWAIAAAKGKTKPREIVDAVVAAAGQSVKESNGAALSDSETGRPEGAQETTARTILTEHEGSRTWLIVRALRELGIQADVVVAEAQPFSADPHFPAHEGRFGHPLAVAHLQSESDAGQRAIEDVWIDADVPGPPLPAGHISPELRGRAALHADGHIAPLPASDANDGGDEVDVRLAVDAQGDAKGSLTVLLRGRAAQELAEVLLRSVGDERQRVLRGAALAWVPFADVDDVVLSSTEESWQVALRAQVTVPGYAQVEGTQEKTWVLPGIDPIHTVWPRPTVATLGATFASQGGREGALAVNHAFQYHVHRRVELPAGATVTRTPSAVEVKDDVLAAARRIGVAGNVVEDDFTLSLQTGTVAASAYGGFAADAHRVDDGFLASTRVKPAP